MKNVPQQFDHFYKVIASPTFLNMDGQGGEIPFFIAPYDARQELEVRVAIKGLRNKLENDGVTVLEINLYDLVCEILIEKGGMERMFEVEKGRSKDKFLKALQSTLNIHQVLMPKVKELVDGGNAQVYFLTGIGLVFPYVRSHNVLNNLQNIAKEAPTVAFFPGSYNGHSLNLFGVLKDDNYYRAFNIETTKVLIMKIKELFEKDINRNIETVIKADDRDHISDEVMEYVVTREIAKKIGDLFQAYNNYAGANGVWISGFFGSGKSHLLKILSYVLENKEFNGYKSGELFAEKIEDDAVLKGDIEKASRTPSESILFNIDQQAQITSKSDENALLAVFYKVFYDHLGYYGFQPHVAEFEMWVDKQGHWEAFKKKFKTVYGKPWEEARTDYFDPKVMEAMAEVLGALNKTDAAKYANILDELEDKQKQSIEDLCARVSTYIGTKPKGFRLNFFVDEVGQYISDNTKLMLNLQTIAETLATKTKGNSWILVTSQQDMEKVVGDMNKQQQNDFSRIQARFHIKVPLTSANVDEVIEKRLLKKNDAADKKLVKIYKQDSAHMGSLLSFSEVGVQFKGYKNEADFASKYPFVPYQFDLFQNCRRALSTHNAFQGRHASVGERSMLGVFQQVSKAIEEQELNALVSFDLMFEGIRNELRGEFQSMIILAEKQLGNPLAVKVLKALFLVKYFANFKTTVRNVTVLMIDDAQVDIKEHEKAIILALNVLENQSYVQRNGEEYEFLTDDEKDVERAIKDTDIDEQAVTNLLKEIFFDEIIRDQRITYLDNKQTYAFTSKIDGALLGKEQELEVEVITENHTDHENLDFLKAQTMGSTGMKLLLPPDAVFMKDVRMYLRTDKYVRVNQATANRDELKRILREKAEANAQRKRTLVQLAGRNLAEATVYLNGAAHEMGHTSDGKTRVVTAFQDLVKIVYPNLRMLGPQPFSEDTIKQIIRSKQDDLFGADEQTISEAESEVLTLVARREKQSDRTTLLDLKNHFARKPYGWYPNAVWVMVARLYKRGKLELKQDSNLLEDDTSLTALLNSAQQANTLLQAQVGYDSATVKALKDAYAEAFDESCPAKEAKDVAQAFKAKLEGMKIAVDQLLVQQHDFPFLQSLSGLAKDLERWTDKDYAYYLTQLKEFKDELLDAKEDKLDPIKQFMNGERVKIYKSIRDLLGGDTSNLEYVKGEEQAILEAVLADEAPYKGNKVQDAKKAMDALRKKVLDRIEEERGAAIGAIQNTITALEEKSEYKKLKEPERSSIVNPLLDVIDKLKEQKFIARIRDMKQTAVDQLYPLQLTELMQLAAPKVKGGDAQEPQVQYIKRNNIMVAFEKNELRTDEDVDAYVKALAKELKAQIKDNRRIVL